MVTLTRIAAAVALAMPAAVVAAPAAHAALSQCNGIHSWTSSGLYTERPGYRSGNYSTLRCVLGMGSSGEAVRVLQVALIYCNIPDPGPADGIYGTKTANAIRWIQWATGIAQDGVYGPQTESVMGWIYTSNGKSKCG